MHCPPTAAVECTSFSEGRTSSTLLACHCCLAQQGGTGPLSSDTPPIPLPHPLPYPILPCSALPRAAAPCSALGRPLHAAHLSPPAQMEIQPFEQCGLQTACTTRCCWAACSCSQRWGTTKERHGRGSPCHATGCVTHRGMCPYICTPQRLIPVLCSMRCADLLPQSEVLGDTASVT